MKNLAATKLREPSSFRDNFGFVFRADGQLYRQINEAGKTAYDQLMSSGLYQRLTESGLLVPHQETDLKSADGGYKIIQPQELPLITYPYEWSFSQLKDAALATLAIQKQAIQVGLTLRDASAYNIQLAGGRPVLIDSLSFEPQRDGQPWQAYRQFCQHFLAPLSLMSYVDVDLLQLSRVYIDGLPLPLAAKLLPLRAKARPGLATHVNLHARFQRQHGASGQKQRQAKLSRSGLIGLIESLEGTVRSLRLNRRQTEWADYYDNTNYSDRSFKEKQQAVGDLVKKVKPERVIDLGANNGAFSRIAAEHSRLVISADIDPLAVEDNYRQVRASKDGRVFPILLDLTNPSPDLGWANQERSSFSRRAQGDLVLALALVHHLAISNNLPLGMIAEYLARLAPKLLIEFVPKSDSQVKRLLATREDIFPDYDVPGFEAAFGQFYKTSKKQPLAGTERILYLMERREQD